MPFSVRSCRGSKEAISAIVASLAAKRYEGRTRKVFVHLSFLIGFLSSLLPFFLVLHNLERDLIEKKIQRNLYLE